MENASKALLIAGGILISIIIISLFLSMYNRMSSFQKSQETEKEFKQISAFNSGYEAFNKQVMYGTDIITLMNKAIENNITKNASSGDINYINIKLKIKKNYESTVTIDNKVTGKVTKLTGQAAVDTAAMYNIAISSKALIAGSTYELGSWTNKENELIMDDEIIKFFASDTKDYVKQKTLYGHTGPDNDVAIYYIYSALTNFKLSRFKCTAINYDNNGRIKEMSFEEYSN